MNTNFVTWPVDGPPPLAPVYGLLQAATAPAAGVRFVVDTDEGPLDLNDLPADVILPNAGRERWLNGIAVYPYPAGTPNTWDPCTGSPGPPAKDIGENIEPPEFNALTVYQAITCTAQQVPDQAAFKARAVAALSASDGYAVARELMCGLQFDTQPYLADGLGTFPNGNVATRANHGLQILEEAIAETGSLGLIHCSPMLATALMGWGFALSDKTGVIRTINGIVVIPDYGYARGCTPNGRPAPGPTEEWAFATGPVDIRRSEVFTNPPTLAEALDRSLGATEDRPNTITYYAERYYVTDWDTALQAAVLIDRCAADCAVGS